MYDSNGNVKPTRLSALLNAALGYVADQTQGFIDFDAVPEDGASIQVCLLSSGPDRLCCCAVLCSQPLCKMHAMRLLHQCTCRPLCVAMQKA